MHRITRPRNPSADHRARRLDLVEEGRIVGLVGPNGAGKTTALNAILGLTPYQGELKVLGRDPWTERDRLMRDVCFIADVAVLPRWMRVSQALDYVAGVHPRFDRGKAEGFLARTAIKRGTRSGAVEGMSPSWHRPWSWPSTRASLLDEPTWDGHPVCKQFSTRC